MSCPPRPPLLGRVRLANPADAHKIMTLVNESISQTFRVEYVNDIIYLIENAILSICQLDEHDIIIGFLAARDYPLIPAVHPSAWESYVWTKYKSTELNARNTLFLHLLCWNPQYSRDLVDNMLKTMFMHDAYLHHVAMVKSLCVKYPLLVHGQSRSEASFRRVQVSERGVNGDVLPVLYIADRTEVSPRLRVRRAVEEDNDDLVPIMENHSERLQQLYGEFYISELVSRHPESDRVLLVCEHNELAVGVMCLNTTVNYEALEESYILSPFAGLRHLNTDSPVSRVAEPEVSSISFSVDPALTDVAWHAKLGHTENQETPMNSKSAIYESPSMFELRDPFRSSRAFDMLLEDEEEELDYDIVNIDTELLRVPEILFLEKQTEWTTSKEKQNVDDSLSVKHITKQPSDLKRAEKNDHLPDPVRYKGAPNAFVLELFAMHPDYDERYGFDILEAAYEIFPNRDYCIISLPSNHAPYPLLEHFTPVTPIGTKIRFINESLYVAHINSIRGNMSLRWGEHYDKPALDIILENAPRVEALKNLFASTLGSKTLESFIFCSENQPIGMIVIGPLEDGTVVRTQYELEPEPRRPGTDGAILTGVMSPVLEPHSRWFMRELLRQSRYSTLFWICRLFAKGDLSPTRNLMAFGTYMSPVHPRKSIPNISQDKNLDNVYRHLNNPFALWILEKPLTSIPKVYVNNSIVVVGASRTGLAFLETLFMGPTSPYLTFSNVSLVSENGLATVNDCLKAADICVPGDGRFTDRYIKCTPFYFYVDVITSVMVGIDRKKKCIHLKGGGTKYYDTLVLTCGQQFQHPAYMEDALELAKEVQEGKPCDRLLIDNPKYKEDRVPPPPDLPSNVFLINSLFEANIVFRKLMRMITDIKEESMALSASNQVVVYGDFIEAYSCIAALLELGIQSKMIVFLENFPPEDPNALRVNCFNDETVDDRVQAKLKELGIYVIRECYLVGWNQVGNMVYHLELMTPMRAISLNCFALFYYGLQAINSHAFKAINECGLVYDGGLIVSPTFETNDPNIFGAGTIVSYSRRLYATRRLHRNYCSEDIGEALAKLFLKRLDPFVMFDFQSSQSCDLLPTCTSSILGFRSHCSLGGASTSKMRIEALNQFRRWQPVMKFESPIVKFATLPGPLYYLKVRKSGKDVPMGAHKLLPNQGHTLITDKDGNYFCVQLNVLHVVEGVTCLSNKPFSPDIMSQLFGKHEAVFNGLHQRYMKNMIDDFYEFFTQPWMSALYLETFAELIDEIDAQDMGLTRDLMKSKFTTFEDAHESMSVIQDSEIGLRPASSFSLLPLESLTLQKEEMGTFRSIIEKYMNDTHALDPRGDIPSECGQSVQQRRDAGKLWEKLSGEAIVTAHLRKFLQRNSVTNPHYAKPKPH